MNCRSRLALARRAGRHPAISSSELETKLAHLVADAADACLVVLDVRLIAAEERVPIRSDEACFLSFCLSCRDGFASGGFRL